MDACTACGQSLADVACQKVTIAVMPVCEDIHDGTFHNMT